jgi:anti-sigma B factor antagonist
MSITVTCPQCGKKLKADEKYVGKKGRCPGCGNAITIEGPSSLTERAMMNVGASPASPPAARPAAAPAAAARPAATTTPPSAARPAAAAPPGAQVSRPPGTAAPAPSAKARLLMTEGYGDVHVVRFQTSRVLDGSNVSQLGEELDDLVMKRYMTKMILNFENVQYMSSAVLGKLITLNKNILKEKGKLKLCSIDKNVFEIFSIMKLDKLFAIYDTEEEALESFGKFGIAGGKT